MKSLTYCFSAFAATAFFLGGLFPHAASAQTNYPSRSIRLVIPWSVGGSTDVIGRLLAESMSKDLGTSIVVDNKPGATGTIGYANVAKAEPDGYTMLMGTNSTFAMAPHYYKDLPFNLEKDFRPLGMVASNPQILSVNPSVPVKSVEEFIAYLKQNPGKLAFASAGYGGSSHLAMELFLAMSGTEMLHVPYKAGAPAMQSLMAGDTKAAFVDISIGEATIRSGAIRALGSSGRNAMASLPDIPPIAEAGLPGFESVTSFGLFVPKGTSDSVVQRLNQALKFAMHDEAVVKRLASFGFELESGNPDEYPAYAAAEKNKWGDVIAKRGIKIQ